MLRRAVTYTYGALALIPTGLSLGSAFAYANGDENKARAWAFWAWSGWTALPYSVLLFALVPTTFLFDPVDRKSLDWVQQCWAKTTLRPFVRFDKPNIATQASGKKIIVSNHQSFLDILILLACFDDLHFVSKKEVFYIPLVGWVMGLIGHVALSRGDKNSGRSALENCEKRLQHGKNWSVVFFAEGKRAREGATDRVGEFKIGAFKLAAATGVDILPVTIVGSGRAMPPGKELEHLDGDAKIQIKVHDAIISGGEDKAGGQNERAEELRAKCWNAVSKGLEA